jgi:hypothetical protein
MKILLKILTTFALLTLLCFSSASQARKVESNVYQHQSVDGTTVCTILAAEVYGEGFEKDPQNIDFPCDKLDKTAHYKVFQAETVTGHLFYTPIKDSE